MLLRSPSFRFSCVRRARVRFYKVKPVTLLIYSLTILLPSTRAPFLITCFYHHFEICGEPVGAMLRVIIC